MTTGHSADSTMCFFCDTCSESTETDHIDFGDAWDQAKAAGWRSYKGPDKKWAHSCPSCTEDFAKGKR